MDILDFFSLPIEEQNKKLRPFREDKNIELSKLPEYLGLDTDGFEFEKYSTYDLFYINKDGFDLSLQYCHNVDTDGFTKLRLSNCRILLDRHIDEWKDRHIVYTAYYFDGNSFQYYASRYQISFKELVLKLFEFQKKIVELVRKHSEYLINLERTYRRISYSLDNEPYLSDVISSLYVLTEAFPEEDVTVEGTLAIMLSAEPSIVNRLKEVQDFIRPENIRDIIDYRAYITKYMSELPAYLMYPYLYFVHKKLSDKIETDIKEFRELYKIPHLDYINKRNLKKMDMEIMSEKYNLETAISDVLELIDSSLYEEDVIPISKVVSADVILILQKTEEYCIYIDSISNSDLGSIFVNWIRDDILISAEIGRNHRISFYSSESERELISSLNPTDDFNNGVSKLIETLKILKSNE